MANVRTLGSVANRRSVLGNNVVGNWRIMLDFLQWPPSRVKICACEKKQAMWVKISDRVAEVDPSLKG